MARYQVVLAYDGTHFAGYQRQKDLRTVQGTVEAGLRKLGWEGRAVLSAGRTDTGVHAAGQVIAFDLEWAHSPHDLLEAMNANLPPDIAAQHAQVSHPDFHPRYDALGRRYRYRLFCKPVRSPLRERYAWRIWPDLDFLQLQKAAQPLIGTHDFGAYGSPLRSGGSTLRTVFSARWQVKEEDLVFDIAANAFLYHMVRRLVYLQVLVGLGKLELDNFVAGLTSKTPYQPGLAPSQGLVLAEVIYPEPGSEEAGSRKTKRSALPVEMDEGEYPD